MTYGDHRVLIILGWSTLLFQEFHWVDLSSAIFSLDKRVVEEACKWNCTPTNQTASLTDLRKELPRARLQFFQYFVPCMICSRYGRQFDYICCIFGIWGGLRYASLFASHPRLGLRPWFWSSLVCWASEQGRQKQSVQQSLHGSSGSPYFCRSFVRYPQLYKAPQHVCWCIK
jgi:hypothetical protein